MRYILFVKESCSYCSQAVGVLKQNNLPHSVINFKPNQEEILVEIKKAYGWDTVPMVFYRSGSDIKFIGGFTDLQQWLRDV